MSKRTLKLTLTKEQWAAIYAAVTTSEELVDDEDLEGLGDHIRLEYGRAYPAERGEFITH